MNDRQALLDCPQLLSPDFAHLQRHRLGGQPHWLVRIGPGEYYATAREELITTVLGSCVAACVRNRTTGVGGMNHFLLPSGSDEDVGRWRGTPVSAALRYGNVAMEKLINVVLGSHPRRDQLEIKVFGGARVLRANIDVGDRNAAFVRDYLAKEKLPIAAGDLGGLHPRKIVFNPRSGVVLVKLLGTGLGDRIADRERSYLERVRHEPVTGDLELFGDTP